MAHICEVTFALEELFLCFKIYFCTVSVKHKARIFLLVDLREFFSRSRVVGMKKKIIKKL